MTSCFCACLIVAISSSQAEARTERLRDAISQEVAFMTRIGNLTADETARLSREAAGVFHGADKETADAFGRNSASWPRQFVRINGRLASLDEAASAVVRSQLAPSLKLVSRMGWEKLCAEQERLDMRRKLAAAVAQVAMLDEVLLLSTEQRAQFSALLAARRSDAWWRPTNADSPLVHSTERLQAAIAGDHLGRFVVPDAELSAILRPAQWLAINELGPNKQIRVIVLETADKPGADRQPPAMAPAHLVRVLRPALPIEEQSLRLGGYLARLIDDADSSCRLTDLERHKLLLAGKLDIDRWQEQLAPLEDVREGEVALIQPVESAAGDSYVPRSIFHDKGSCYRKAVYGGLLGDRKQSFAAADCARVEFHRQALLQTVVAGFEHAASLTARQCAALLQVLNEAVAKSDVGQGADWRARCLRQIAELSETRFRPLFCDFQWPAASRQLIQLNLIALELESDGASAAKPTARVVVRNKDGTVSRFR